ncbi:MAG: hypothetical protein Tsb002_08710 [Wenzhouxiangellaceae bacterium]
MNKTRQTEQDVAQFLAGIDHEVRRNDSHTLLEMMAAITGQPAKIWGPSMIGFGRYHYRYESGREGHFFITGFAPRKNEMVIYIMPGFSDYAHLLDKLGPHRTGKSCLYVKKLDKLDLDVLKQLITLSVETMRQRYQTD